MHRDGMRRHLPERSERLPVCQVHHRRGTLPLYLVRATGPVWAHGMYGWTPSLCGETGLHVQRTKILARQRTLPSGGLYVQLCRAAMENPAGRTSHHGNGIPECPRRLVGQRRCGTDVGLVYFASLGFYPVCPGSPYYVLASPSFSKATLHLENGKTFTLQAENTSKENIYIQQVTLNGKPYTRNYITHKDITEGGEMVFVMGNMPNKTWGSAPEDCPPSLIEKF